MKKLIIIILLFSIYPACDGNYYEDWEEDCRNTEMTVKISYTGSGSVNDTNKIHSILHVDKTIDRVVHMSDSINLPEGEVLFLSLNVLSHSFLLLTFFDRDGDGEPSGGDPFTLDNFDMNMWLRAGGCRNKITEAVTFDDEILWEE